VVSREQTQIREAPTPGVTEGYEPGEVPLYEGQAGVEEGYAAAERERRPFFAVEAYEQGYAVTYDLLPAGVQLTAEARAEVADLLTAEVEAVVADADRPTTEVSRSVNDSLGNVSLFGREDSARRVAAAVSRVVLDETNWTEASPPEGAVGDPRN